MTVSITMYRIFGGLMKPEVYGDLLIKFPNEKHLLEPVEFIPMQTFWIDNRPSLYAELLDD